jgi:hypothetical protein
MAQAIACDIRCGETRDLLASYAADPDAFIAEVKAEYAEYTRYADPTEVPQIEPWHIHDAIALVRADDKPNIVGQVMR